MYVRILIREQTEFQSHIILHVLDEHRNSTCTGGHSGETSCKWHCSILYEYGIKLVHCIITTLCRQDASNELHALNMLRMAMHDH